MHNLEAHIEACLKQNRDFTSYMSTHMLINDFTIYNQEKFQTNSAVYITKIGSKFRLLEQITNLNFFRKEPTVLVVYHVKLPGLINEKAQFTPALRRDLNIHSFYSVEEYLMFKMTPNQNDCNDGCSWWAGWGMSGAATLGSRVQGAENWV
jgi:hypothetical protein